MNKHFLLVEADILPEVFGKVLKAKQLLALGRARNVSAAVKQVGLSRSAFYKYKDSIFDSDSGREQITLSTLLRDETGALQQLLTCISDSGASVVTINQSTPENATAKVSVAVRTGDMRISLEQLLDNLQRQPMIVDVFSR